MNRTQIRCLKQLCALMQKYIPTVYFPDDVKMLYEHLQLEYPKFIIKLEQAFPKEQIFSSSKLNPFFMNYFSEILKIAGFEIITIDEYDYIKICNFIKSAIIRASLPYWWYRFTQTDKASHINWLSNFAMYLSKIYPFTEYTEQTQLSAFRAIKETFGLSFKDSLYEFGFMYPEFMSVYNSCLKN